MSGEWIGWVWGLFLGWLLCVVWVRVIVLVVSVWGTVVDASMPMGSSSYLLFIVIS